MGDIGAVIGTQAILGVAGTRRDPSMSQLRHLYTRMTDLHETLGCRTLVHGCCTGFDAAAHHLARSLGWHIKGCPPSNSVYLAEAEWRDCDESLPTQGYAERNASIIRACTVLVAGPLAAEDDERSRRSGTWMTVRMARDARKPWVAVYPDGKLTYGEWS